MSDHDPPPVGAAAHDESGCDHDHANPWPNRSLALAAALTLSVLVAQWTGLAGETMLTPIAAARRRAGRMVPPAQRVAGTPRAAA